MMVACQLPAAPSNCSSSPLPSPSNIPHYVQRPACSQEGDSFPRGIFVGKKNQTHALRVLLWLCVTCIGDEVEASTLQTEPRVAFTRHRETVGEGHKQSISSSIASLENKL